ncbi:MAG: hypothetical protein PHG08_00280 [Bacilli bacterium]|nr:hypothetical protein [Bacilli bacterium]
MTKVCSKCGVEKDLVEFSKCSAAKDGLQKYCKACAKTKKHEWQSNNIDHTKKYGKAWDEKNLDKRREYDKKRYKENPKKYNDRSSKYYYNNKEEILSKQKIYNENNSEKKKERDKKYYRNNIERITNLNKDYKNNHKEYYKEYLIMWREKHKIHISIRQKICRINDPLFKLKGNIRSLIGGSIRKGGYKKSSQTAAILGCTFEEFKLHIEKQFKEGMSWDNRELWHLDHIYPVSLAADEQHLLQLNHYTNFQPLWAEDNLKKGNKII